MAGATLLNMYLGVDIGGTKTLVAALNSSGIIIKSLKFPTDHNYHKFIEQLEHTIKELDVDDYAAGAVGVPATKIDRHHGRAMSFGNLPWPVVAIQHDIEQIAHCPIVVENDAKLAALSESRLLKDRFRDVLYVTVSTGIGYGLVIDGVIDKGIGDGGGRTILLEHNGKMTPWEDFASGKALVERYGKLAKDIHDDATWKSISRNLAQGFIELIAITQPEVIVLGGSVGHYFERYKEFLTKDIEKYKIPLVNLPVLLKAQRPEEAVIYGCYDIAKQVYPHAKAIS